MHTNLKKKKKSHFIVYKSEVLRIREISVSKIGHVTCYPQGLVGFLLVVQGCINGQLAKIRR